MKASVRSEAHSELRDGSARTCVVSRARHDPDDLIRFVLDPDGRVTPDMRRRLPGRGVWVRADRASVALAVRKGAFARAFRQQVVVGEDLPTVVETLLLHSVRQALAIANKAGLALAGAFQVEGAIAKGKAAVLLQASDGSPAELGKMRQAFLRSTAGSQAPIVDFLDSVQIGLALGRTSVIHAALKPGAASAAFAARCQRLSIYRTGIAAAAASADDLTGAIAPDPCDEKTDEDETGGPGGPGNGPLAENGN